MGNRVKKILEMTKFLNDRGMTLVEVMIAGSIGVAIFLYLNQTMVRFNKTQVRSERKSISREVQKSVHKILEDTDSWISNPEEDIPKRSNEANFYYFRTPGEEIVKVSYTLKEIQDLDRKFKTKVNDFKCPPAIGNCRFMLFTYGNKMITGEEIPAISRSHFRVAVGFETKDEKISRSYLPEFKVLILDTNQDSEIRVNNKIFYVNSTGSKRNGNSSYIVKNGKKIDIKTRTKCFTEVDKISQNKSHALSLCQNALSLAPVDCYRKFRKSFNVPPDMALIACVNAQNIEAVKCFESAKGLLRTSDTNLAILCSAAQSEMPIKCIQEIKKSGFDMTKSAPYKVCSRAEDLTPAKCFNKLLSKSKTNLEYSLYLCPHHK